MSLGEDLVAYLKAQTAVSDLVGAKIFPGVGATSQALPYVTLQKITGISEKHATGTTPLTEEAWQVDVWSATILLAREIAAAIRDVLDDVTTDIGSTTIERTYLEDESESHEFDRDGSEAGHYRIRMTFDIHYRRTAPTGP